MKIIFLCANLEPGQDGVGDYARRLAGELIRQGQKAGLIGLNDGEVSEPAAGFQTIENQSIPVLRLPAHLDWRQKTDLSRRWINDFAPDWISLQFVPFAFHPKGMIGEFSEHLATIVASHRLHWMFHELWILWNFPLTLRKRLLGQAQKIYIKRSLKRLRPAAVSTQLPIYQNALRTLGVSPNLLPLHGNIPVQPRERAKVWRAEKCPSLSFSGKVIAGFFGNLLPTLDLSTAAEQISSLKIPSDRLLILLAGKTSGATEALWNSLRERLEGMASFHALGQLDEREASSYFSSLDYGLTSYPVELMLKSGSVAAMREHGVPIIAFGRLSKKGNVELSNSNAAVSWTVKDSADALLKQLETVKP